MNDLPQGSESYRRRNPHLFGVAPGNVALKGVAVEADLHDEIIEACRSQGWLYFHSRMDRRVTTTVGQPDFIILIPHGKVFMCECKTKDGKQTPAQRDVTAHAAKLGHRIAIVRSMTEFWEALNH